MDQDASAAVRCQAKLRKIAVTVWGKGPTTPPIVGATPLLELNWLVRGCVSWKPIWSTQPDNHGKRPEL